MFWQWLIGLEMTWVMTSVWVPILTAQSPNSGEVQSHLSTGIPARRLPCAVAPRSHTDVGRVGAGGWERLSSHREADVHADLKGGTVAELGVRKARTRGVSASVAGGPLNYTLRPCAPRQHSQARRCYRDPGGV